MWLSHHQPEQYDRCLRVGRWHVCRRCALLYPLAFLVMAITLAGGWSAGRGPAVLVVILPLPAVVEFCLEQLRTVGYRPWRQLVVTAPLAIGLGIGFARYLEDVGDPVFWITVVVYGAACLGTVLWRVLDERVP